MRVSHYPSDVFRPQQSTNTRPMLSSDIVRPAFQRGAYTSGSMSPSRGVKRSHSSELPPASGFTGTYALVDDCMSQEPQPKPKRTRLQTQRRREQCRANQARYREKQLAHAKAVEEGVQKLRADVPVLELQRNRLLYGDHQSVWNVVVEYFHFFRFGVPVTREEGVSSTKAKHQLAFLRSCMAEDVNLGARTGVDALMEQWRLYSSVFRSLYFELERVERVTDQFVSVTATLNVTVSETTLEKVLPGLEDQALCSRIWGKRLRFRCSLWFEWDATVCRVSRLETTMDLTTPLLRLLGNLSDVSTVLKHARITPDGAVVRDN